MVILQRFVARVEEKSLYGVLQGFYLPERIRKAPKGIRTYGVTRLIVPVDVGPQRSLEVKRWPCVMSSVAFPDFRLACIHTW